MREQFVKAKTVQLKKDFQLMNTFTHLSGQRDYIHLKLVRAYVRLFHCERVESTDV